MKHIKTFFVICMLVTFNFACKQNTEPNTADLAVKTEVKTDPNGFSYEVINNDPTGLRLYTLENGLQVYLSKNTDEPKIQTYIAVRAGSNYDPSNSTGLAHYLEHMLFKGTDKIGSIDWEKEQAYIQEISDLYEAHRAETDEVKKLEIYKKIDEVSLEASNYAVANEYDKMVSGMGATGTNAHTWFEETVYKNKIPANELNKWLSLESERFSKLVLRLFHTELEAVFEEFNRSQDNDGRKVYTAMLDALFPNHPYGQQQTIGTAAHLKNPSLVDINNYFNKYYVPNNMAMVLVGDLNFDKTIASVNQTFGKLKYKEVSHPTLAEEAPITAPISKEVFGPTSEGVTLAFRSNGVNSEDEKFVTLADMILTNGEAGLIDLNLNQKQLVQRAGCYTMFLNDYGLHQFYGDPQEGQTLDEVKDLILSQIDKLKKGEFDDWLIEAVVNDLKLSQTREYENSTALASAYYNAFIHHQKWEDQVKFLDELKAITKEDLVAFANRFYKDNYVVVYKRKGEDSSIVKVENPGITPVNLNRDKSSQYLTDFQAIKPDELEPKFVDYKSAIKEKTLENGINVSYIENETNDLFNLDIIFDMGTDNDKKLSLAVGFLEYLGTETMSAETIKKEFYKLGVNYYVFSRNDVSYIGLSGLKENLPKGLALLEDLITNAKSDPEAYANYVDKILKERQDGKTQKSNILWNGLVNYGKYGENSRLRNIMKASELKAQDPQELVDIVKGLKDYKQRIFYYGKDVDQAVAALNKEHKLNMPLKDYPEATTYVEKETGGHVYFANYDMVQSEMVFLAKGQTFDAEKMAAASLFNAYFGSGLSSIVFQEIRESKSLAYSAFSSYNTAGKLDDSNYVLAYIGTQANKMDQAVEAMMSLMSDMPEAEKQFQAAKDAALKKIAAERITKANIFWEYEGLKKLGIEKDNREAMYNTIKNMEISDLRDFFNDNIKGENYNVMVVGNKKDIDFNALKKLGEVEEMDVDYLFNYETTDKVKL
ncbi:insulinase family protein [Formosa sediminum]|uniref:Insulinase family protein n=1 Tax=Formosa sediminum TaxID=2594004 RepID=A0A516GU05_9FLAO|nr:M16 family metallopeptidase [Formosa sediminum]QDO95004.1 insulinase family protein [Formosa sediminum]